METIFWSAAWEGMALGFGLAFLIGPAFFALLQASIDYGFSVSVAIAAGVVCSDIMLMTTSFMALRQLEAIPYFHTTLSVVGGCVLFGSGLLAILQKRKPVAERSWNAREFGKLFIKGFSINTFNPFPWIFWLSTSAFVHQRFGAQTLLAPFTFFAMAACTVFGTDVLKAWGAQFILQYLNDTILIWFRRISGLCLMGFGLQLLWMAATSH